MGSMPREGWQQKSPLAHCVRHKWDQSKNDVLNMRHRVKKRKCRSTINSFGHLIMYNVSTNFLVLMSYELMKDKGIGWDNEDALQYLDIPCRPSAVEQDPVPPKITGGEARQISELITAVSLQPSVDKARQFVESNERKNLDKARQVYVLWYRRYLCRQVNKRMNAAMIEAATTVPDILRLQEDDSYPLIGAFNVNDIGMELVGKVSWNGQILASNAAPLVRALFGAALARVRKTYTRGQAIILGKKVGTSRALDGGLWLKAQLLMKRESCFCCLIEYD